MILQVIVMMYEIIIHFCYVWYFWNNLLYRFMYIQFHCVKNWNFNQF